MPQEYDNTNTGALFKNTEKQDVKDRDYSGSINVGGVEYWLSAWIKTSKKGDKFMSLAVKPKEETYKGGIRKDATPAKASDDIPFAQIGKWL